MGYDSDHPRSQGEVGKTGVAISSLADMEVLFDGIPLDKVSTSMTINGPAIILWAFYIAAAEKQGVSSDKLRGTIQNDILKEYMAQHAWCFPIEPALRLIVDCFEWGAKHAPLWNTISISGYHIREAGSTAAQELAFTLADGFTYIERGIARGLDVDDFAPRLSFFWDIHNDFFEEIAKLRAARRIWARHLKERYGAKSPRSWIMRFHSQTAGVTLTAQQPMNNVVRVAYQALAAVLGGTQSLHTNSMDETLALPTEEAVQVALRTQQVLAYETGVPNVIDPLGGSYYIEALTDQLEREAEALFEEIETGRRRRARTRDGLVPAQDRRVGGAPAVGDRAASSRDRRRERVRDRRARAEHPDSQGRRGAPSGRSASAWRRCAPSAISRRATKRWRSCAKRRAGTQNVFPFILDCARRYCTLYEIRAALETCSARIASRCSSDARREQDGDGRRDAARRSSAARRRAEDPRRRADRADASARRRSTDSAPTRDALQIAGVARTSVAHRSAQSLRRGPTRRRRRARRSPARRSRRGPRHVRVSPTRVGARAANRRSGSTGDHSRRSASDSRRPASRFRPT